MPLLWVVVGVALMLVLMLVVKLDAFFALLLTSFVVALLNGMDLLDGAAVDPEGDRQHDGRRRPDARLRRDARPAARRERRGAGDRDAAAST